MMIPKLAGNYGRPERHEPMQSINWLVRTDIVLRMSMVQLQRPKATGGTGLPRKQILPTASTMIWYFDMTLMGLKQAMAHSNCVHTHCNEEKITI